MHRFEKRIEKLRDMAYTFVPDPEYSDIAKALKSDLERAEKRPGLEARIKHLDSLFQSWKRTSDPEVQEAIRRVFENDHEVMYRYMLVDWEDRATIVPGGAWVEKGLGTRALAIERQRKSANAKNAEVEQDDGVVKPTAVLPIPQAKRSS